MNLPAARRPIVRFALLAAAGLTVAAVASADEASDYAQAVARLTPQQCRVLLSNIDGALVRTEQGILFAERRMRDAKTSPAAGVTAASTALLLQEYNAASRAKLQLIDYRRRLYDLRGMVLRQLQRTGG